jgi:hypothetical protein
MNSKALDNVFSAFNVCLSAALESDHGIASLTARDADDKPLLCVAVAIGDGASVATLGQKADEAQEIVCGEAPVTVTTDTHGGVVDDEEGRHG